MFKNLLQPQNRYIFILENLVVQMKKGLIFLIFISILFLSVHLASSQSVDSSMAKLTHAAEEYETGNINYAQLLVYLASSGKELAEEMGAVSKYHDPILGQEQLEKALGAPTEKTKWIWVEGEDREKKLDSDIPAWRKIIFDGKKIQLHMNSWPNIKLVNGEEKIVYRLHTDISFKSEEEEIDIKSEIEKMKILAQEYSSNPTKDSLEKLAEESTNIEKAFNENPYRSGEKCENLMNNLFGSENKRETQEIISQDITFFEGDNFEVKLRLEMCDNCEWHWINFNINFETRGRFKQPEGSKNYDSSSRERYSSYTNEEFQNQIKSALSRIKSKLENKEYQSAMDEMMDLRTIMDAWNEKSNDVWKQFENQFKVDFESMTQEQREECSNNYCWITEDQKRMKAQKELQNKNHEERKQFFLNLFSEYDKKEFRSLQQQWEERLFEEFREFGEEICNNNIDDNDNDQIDCGEPQCTGKVCGKSAIIITDENGIATEQNRDLHCIASICQAKEEVVEVKGIICGNNLCEKDEITTCATDCAMCAQQEALACEGNVLFSGKDADSCPLTPICLKEDLTCETDDDCTDPLCGESSCVEGTCQLAKLTECRDAECIDGETKVQNCNSGEEMVIGYCKDGMWKETGIECAVSSIIQPAEPVQGETSPAEPVEEEEVVGNECTVKSNCGNEDDVCSNGKCVTLPKVADELSDDSEQNSQQDESSEQSDYIELEPPQNQEDSQEENKGAQTSETDSGSEDAPSLVTGNTVFSFFKSIITGFQVEENNGANTQQSTAVQQDPNSIPALSPRPDPSLSPGQENPQQFNSPQEENTNEDRDRENQEDRKREDQQRRTKECDDRCSRECYDREIRPLTETCIREECGNELDCVIDEVKDSCEEKAKTEADIDSCTTDCSTKCLAGENTWVEQEKQGHKEERFVFTVGGACRQEENKLNQNIWFNGWGDDFRDFHLVKEKYYSHGGADWCKREYDNLMAQRKELENSLDEEFAKWFFEDYVASSAKDWEKLISGIFDIYSRDVDLSKQIADRQRCLGKTDLPPHNLINFEYETDYGSIEFWEEITTTDMFDDGTKIGVISPFTRLSLFPSREFYRSKLKEAMEEHKIPGPDEEKSSSILSEEQRQKLTEEGFLDRAKEFNTNFGEHIIIQFKDLGTGEIVFNADLKINEKDLIHAEPMPPSENPAGAVTVAIDINELLNIIEYEETGKVELHSPPWARRNEVGFVKGVVDGVKMFFMFKAMLDSAVTTPSSAESEAEYFTKMFFEIVMGGDKGEGNKENQDDFNEERKDESTEQENQLTGEIIR